jgi:tetrahydromethanopterin S-methyltransferase subunit H
VFKFDKEQKIFEISTVKIGGQPGQLPTVMIGSIFYHKQKILWDEKAGKFDEETARKFLEKEERMAAKTGNPRIVDVCASYPQAFERLIDFVADAIDGPFTLDGATTDVRIAGARHVGEVGLSERVVYNSITPDAKSEEISAIKEAKIRSAILLTINTKMPTILGRIQVMNRLLSKAKEAGIENILVDTTTLDMPDPGPVSKAVHLVKKKYGFPAGAGTHNAVSIWNKRSKLEKSRHMLACSVANTLPIIMGADFTLYGPIENASDAYFYCSLADAYVAYSMRQEFGIKPLTREHPLYKIFTR